MGAWRTPSGKRRSCSPASAASAARSKRSSARLTEEAECERIMHMIAGIRGGVAGLMAEVVEDHIRTHLVDPERNPGALNAEAADQLIEVVHTYLK